MCYGREWFLGDRPPEINKVFRDFYYSLYSSVPYSHHTALSPFLDSLPLTPLSGAQAAALDAPFTVEEVAQAIGALPSGKTPGLDGLIGDWYNMNEEELVPILLHLFQAMADSGSLPDSMREALIVVLLKPGKDPTLPDSYRPISLLNVDIKVMAKILATRLNRVITSVIHPDQTGFMPGRATDINVKRLQLNIAAAGEGVSTGFVVSLDVYKAFDSVEWEYLWGVLGALGIGPRFSSWVRLLYDCPRARIRTNMDVSSPFSLGRGTRQGCPLSPLLFALAVEPLAAAVRLSTDIQGIPRGSIVEKISLYADDTLVYLADAESSLSSLFALLDRFGSFSGLRVNWAKSSLMPLSRGAILPPILPSGLQVVHRFRYLGVEVSASLLDFLPLNLEPLLLSTDERLKSWASLPLSLAGRINIFKMIYLPKFLYLFHLSPLLPPQRFFKRLCGILRSFYWQDKPPRLGRALLQAPKRHGGLAAPDMYNYFLASQLVYAAWWIDLDLSNAATVLAGALMGSYEGLTNTLYRYTPSSSFPTPLKTVAAVWSVVSGRFPQPAISPRAPLWGNGHLSHLRGLQEAGFWGSHGVKFVAHLFGEDLAFLSFLDMQARFHVPRSAFFRYLQLRHAVQAQFGSLEITPVFSEVELLLGTTDLSKPLTQAYALLQTLGPSPFALAYEKWVADIPDLSAGQWREVEQSYYSTVVSARDLLIQSRFLLRLYYTPEKLKRIGVSPSDVCFRCSVEVGSFLHAVWSCPRVAPFWREVMQFVADHLEFPFLLTPEVCLLGLINDVVPGSHRRLLIRFLFFCARKVVVMAWKDTSPPPLVRWINLVNKYVPLYQALYISRNCPLKFDKVWRPWLFLEASAVSPGRSSLTV